MNINNKTGKLIIISSPSGGGKDSIIKALLKIFPNSTRLITTTSRPKRPKNQEGIDYYFITEEKFKEEIKNNKFVEYNIYSNNYYGTRQNDLNEKLLNYKIVFTQMEVNGKHNLDKLNIPHLAIYLLPENIEILRQRISHRGGLTDKQINDRMNIAKKEIEESIDYDYRIVNVDGKLTETIAKIVHIIKTESINPNTVDKK